MSIEALDLMERALDSPYGLRLAAMTQQAAWTLRKRIYHERDRQRRKGNRHYDSLSVVMKNDGDEIWIVRRDRLPAQERRLAIEDSIEPLRAEHLPKRIVSRGKARSVLFNPLHSILSQHSN